MEKTGKNETETGKPGNPWGASRPMKYFGFHWLAGPPKNRKNRKTWENQWKKQENMKRRQENQEIQGFPGFPVSVSFFPVFSIGFPRFSCFSCFLGGQPADEIFWFSLAGWPPKKQEKLENL
jgi:hypothetical protein